MAILTRVQMINVGSITKILFFRLRTFTMMRNQTLQQQTQKPKHRNLLLRTLNSRSMQKSNTNLFGQYENIENGYSSTMKKTIPQDLRILKEYIYTGHTKFRDVGTQCKYMYIETNRAPDGYVPVITILHEMDKIVIIMFI